MVVLCVTILASVMSICLSAAMLAHRRKARSWARAFRDGAGIRIVATLLIVVAAIFLAAADLLSEPLIALLSAVAGFLLGGAVPAARAIREEERDRADRRGRTASRKAP